jgi:C-terminal binding-module, SLH-like, of glucodextranase
MASETGRRFRWKAHVMMAVSVVAACVLVPLGFILSGPFAVWLKSTGVHASPNLADGYPVAEFDSFDPSSADGQAAISPREAESALAIRKFGVKKVAFRPLSGIGIEPRLNLCFEFDGRLGNPGGDGGELGSTVIHVYLKVPGRPVGSTPSHRAANVEFEGSGWDYEVIVDGFHEQARIFDVKGNLVGQGLGMYVRHEGYPAERIGSSAGPEASRTQLTAGLPMKLLGDPAVGEWQAYLLVGLADLRHPSMMLHSGPDGSLVVFRGALVKSAAFRPGGKPRLRPLLIRYPA